MSNLIVSGKITAGGGHFVANSSEVAVDGYEVAAIAEQGDNYIRLTNGIQICWGEDSWSLIWHGETTANFGAAFVDTSYSITVTPISTASQSSACKTNDFTTSSVAIDVWGIGTSDKSTGCTWIAVGKWK